MFSVCLRPSQREVLHDLRYFQLKTLSIAQLGGIPSEARDHVKLLLNVTPELRPDAHQFSKVNV